MPSKLSENVTLNDLLPTLVNPAKYAQGIYENMGRVDEIHRPVTIRLGVTGGGAFPSYRIESANGEAIAAFNGDDHEPFTNVSIAANKNWSKTAISKDEVMAFWERVYKPKQKG